MKLGIGILLIILQLSVAVNTSKVIQPYSHIVTYVDWLMAQWGADKIAGAIDVPGYTQYPTPYNVVNLAFVVPFGFADAAAIWMNPRQFMNGDDIHFGKTNSEIQKEWQEIFHQHGMKIVLSAFGATWNPTASDPVQICSQLVDYVLNNHLDGLDLDYEDNDAMEKGIAEDWLIKCTRTIRQRLPKGEYILTHAPQAPYFVGNKYYKNGGYVTINNEVGDLIDWYNIQFYNQMETSYDTYNGLFIDAEIGTFSHTSVLEINKAGVPMDKIVVGKPVTPKDASNTGYVPPKDLHDWGLKAQEQIGWHAGWMDWQYMSDIKDTQGTFMNTVVGNPGINKLQKSQETDY